MCYSTNCSPKILSRTQEAVQSTGHKESEIIDTTIGKQMKGLTKSKVRPFGPDPEHDRIFPVARNPACSWGCLKICKVAVSCFSVDWCRKLNQVLNEKSNERNVFRRKKNASLAVFLRRTQYAAYLYEINKIENPWAFIVLRLNSVHMQVPQ